MSQKINQYLIERFSFGNNDYYDIDYWDGTAYQTAKIKGSTILAGIQAGLSSLNISNTDLTLTADRTLDGNTGTYCLNIEDLKNYLVSITGTPGSLVPHIDLQVNPQGTGPIFRVRNTASGTDLFSILNNGAINFNEAYTFPTSDGTAGQVLTTDGSGSLDWVDTQTLTQKDQIQVACSDETTALTVANNVVTFRVPFNCTLTGVRASLSVAGSGGGETELDIKLNGTTIFSNELRIASGSTTSIGFLPPVITSINSFSDDDEIKIDITEVSTNGTEAGLKVTFLVLR